MAKARRADGGGPATTDARGGGTAARIAAWCWSGAESKGQGSKRPGHMRLNFDDCRATARHGRRRASPCTAVIQELPGWQDSGVERGIKDPHAAMLVGCARTIS
ncbi:hypothetical protein BS78_07G076000 [Paspalum vaginatum]|nr:hypothetical protein BS78_07G076000 [Paspalum vaginatum]